MNKRKAKKKYKNLYLNKLASSPIVIDITGGNLQFSRNREIVVIDRRYDLKITLFANIDSVDFVDLNTLDTTYYNSPRQLCAIDGDIIGYKIENI